MRKTVVVLALCVAAAACSSSDDDRSDTRPPTSSTPATSSTGSDSTGSEGTAPAPSSTVPTDPCQGGGVGRGSSVGVVESGGNSYEFQLFVPSSYEGRAVPLVLEFHGLGSDGPAQNGFSGYSALAIKEGFVVVSPTGIPAVGEDLNSWELAQFDIEGRDDVQMTSDLIDRVASMVCVDQTRVYATGLSNGGYFSALLACRMADRIAATFSVAAISHPDDCEPSRPIAMGAVHGTADEVVPYAGGQSSLVTTQEQVEEFGDFFTQVMPDEAAEFAADFGCSTVTDVEIGTDVTLRTHGDCNGGVEVRFYTVEGGGHTWPGSALATALEGALGYATTDIDATDDGWAFLSQYSLPG